MEPQTNEVVDHLAPLKKVTPVSKYLAALLFILAPFLGGYVGYSYATKIAADAPVIFEAPLFVEKEAPSKKSVLPIVRLEERKDIDGEYVGEGVIGTTSAGVVPLSTLGSLDIFHDGKSFYVGNCRYAGVDVASLEANVTITREGFKDAYGPFSVYGQRAVGTTTCATLERYNFEFLGGPYFLSYDDEKIYLQSTAWIEKREGGGNIAYSKFTEIMGADGATFRVASNTAFATDAKRVYGYLDPNPGLKLSTNPVLVTYDAIDPGTFVATQSNYLVKDKNGVYLMGKKIPEANPETYTVVVDMEVFGKWYAKDGARCYLNTEIIDCATMPKDGNDALRGSVPDIEEVAKNITDSPEN